MTNQNRLKTTRRQILAYCIVLVPIAAAPWLIGGTGAFYGVTAILLSLVFLLMSLPVAFRTAEEGDKMGLEKRLFAFSVFYLFALFGALVIDRVAAQYGVFG